MMPVRLYLFCQVYKVAFLWSHLLLLLRYLLKYQAQMQVKITEFGRTNEKTKKREKIGTAKLSYYLGVNLVGERNYYLKQY